MQEAEDEMPSVETQDTKTKEENIISNIKVKTATLMTLEDIKGKINITQEEINRNTETINAVIQLETSRNHDECDFEVISNASVKNSLIKMLDSGRKSLQLPIQLPADEPEIIESDDDGADEEEFKDNGEYFVLRTFEEVKKLIEDYCDRTSSHFVVQKKTKTFGANLKTANFSNFRVQWHEVRLANGVEENTFENVMDYDGIPHIIFGHYSLTCQFGSDSSASQKKRRQEMKEDGRLTVRTRTLRTPSKKCGCPAKIVVKQIIRFPDYKVSKDTVRRKTTQSTSLKERLKTNVNGLTMDVHYVGRLAHIDEHKYHNDEVGFHKEEVHRDLILKAQELYLQGQTGEQILTAINTHVIDEMFWKKEPPDPTRRRYHPKRKDISNYITRIRQLSRFTSDEEEKMHTIVNELKKDPQNKVSFYIKEEKITDDSVVENDDKQSDSPYDEFFEPDTVEKEKPLKKGDKYIWQNFVYCFQTRSQQRLLRIYGNITYLTELELRSTLRSTLPYRCYLMLVQTNVDYQVVGFITVSKQKKNGLIESLKIFQEWNSFWNPKYVFVDYTETMFEAISTLFPDAGQFLNLHSCETNWLEFINTPSNDLLENSEEIISYLRGMQFSLTEEALAKTASLLEGSEIWQQNEKLRRWFQGKWLHLAKCWVFGYRPEDLIVMYHMNLTAVDTVNAYREDILCALRGNGFFEIVHKVCSRIPKEEHQAYIVRNNKNHQYYEKFQKLCVIVSGLQGIPSSLLPYAVCMHTLLEQKTFNIEEAEMGVYNVSCGPDENEENRDENDIDTFDNDFSSIRFLNKNEVGKFNVSFGDMSTYPFCTCAYWNTYRLPCVHMMAIFATIPGWTYHMLSPLYRNHPVLSIDYSTLVTTPVRPNNKECQTDKARKSSAGTQVNFLLVDIFEDVSKIPITDEFYRQVKAFMEDLNSALIMFRDKAFYNKLRFELRRFYFSVTKEMEKKLNTAAKTISLSNAHTNTTGNKSVSEIKAQHDNVVPIVQSKTPPPNELKISATKFNEIAQHNDKVILENATKRLIQEQKLNITTDLSKINEIAQHNDKIILENASKSFIQGQKIKIATDLSKLKYLGNKSKIILVDESGKLVSKEPAVKKTGGEIYLGQQKNFVLIDGKTNPHITVGEVQNLDKSNKVNELKERITYLKAIDRSPKPPEQHSNGYGTKSSDPKGKKNAKAKTTEPSEVKFIVPEQNIKIRGTELGEIKYIGHHNDIIAVDNDAKSSDGMKTSETDSDTNSSNPESSELSVMRLNKKLSYLKAMENGLKLPATTTDLGDMKLSEKLSYLKSKEQCSTTVIGTATTTTSSKPFSVEPLLQPSSRMAIINEKIGHLKTIERTSKSLTEHNYTQFVTKPKVYQNEQKLKINLIGATESSKIKEKMDSICKFDALNANEIKMLLNKHIIPKYTIDESSVSPSCIETLFNISNPTDKSTCQNVEALFSLGNNRTIPLVGKRLSDATTINKSSFETDSKKQKIFLERCSEKIITGIVLNQKDSDYKMKLTSTPPQGTFNILTGNNSTKPNSQNATENIHFNINDVSDQNSLSQIQKIIIDIESQTNSLQTEKKSLPMEDVLLNVEDEIQLECEEEGDLDFKDDIKEGWG